MVTRSAQDNRTHRSVAGQRIRRRGQCFEHPQVQCVAFAGPVEHNLGDVILHVQVYAIIHRSLH